MDSNAPVRPDHVENPPTFGKYSVNAPKQENVTR